MIKRHTAKLSHKPWKGTGIERGGETGGSRGYRRGYRRKCNQNVLYKSMKLSSN